jgi:hypothetical protein
MLEGIPITETLWMMVPSSSIGDDVWQHIRWDETINFSSADFLTFQID